MAIAGLLQHSLVLECAAGFLMTSQAAVFAPSKYGILPEILPEERLSWGNGILELGTFLAIILGTIAAGISTPLVKGREYWSGIALVVLAIFGLFASLSISRVPAAKPDAKFRWNPLGDLFAQIGEIRKDRLLSLAVIGNMYFWFLGALLLINVVLYGTDVMHVSEEVASRLLVASSLGIAFGSFLAGYLSGGKIEYGLVPLGAIGITVNHRFAFAHRAFLSTSVIVHLIFLGFFAGFFAVPINALIQHRPPPDRKGAIIAAANLLSFVGIATAAHRAIRDDLHRPSESRARISDHVAADAWRDHLRGHRSFPIRWCTWGHGSSLARFIASARKAAKISRRRAARCSSQTTCPSSTRCCSSPPPSAPSAS